MAKITRKIRIDGYDILKNSADTFALAVTYDQNRDTLPTDYTTAAFDLIGFKNLQIEEILYEIFDWIEQPRARMGDLSYGYTMRSRLDLEENAEKERRGKAAVERIRVEAPCLDFAMEALDELEAALTADENATLVSAHITLAGSVIDDAIRAAADAFRQINEGRSTLVESFDDVATKGRIAAMEAAGLGEAPTGGVPEECDDLPTLEEIRLRNAKAETISAEIDLRQAEANAFRAEYEIRHESRRKIAADRTEQAVNAIHTHARRFLTPMSMREHDFLRAVIQEEIEKVVGGVL